VLIDMCHCGPLTHADAANILTKPAIWSHTNVRAIHDHPNNLTDEQLDAVARNGGVIGISGIPFYTGTPGATIDRVIDHVDYVRDRIGIEHVGIGLAIFENHPPAFYDQFATLPEDVYGVAPWSWPPGISTISDFPNLTAALLQRGYSEGDVELIMGGNHMRVLEAAWGG
jgi:membrane dipeptidase